MSRWQVQTLAETPFSPAVQGIGTQDTTVITFTTLFQYQALAKAPVTPSETVTMDKWYQRAPDSVDKLKRSASFPETAYFNGFSPNERTTVDKWYQRAPDMVWKLPRAVSFPETVYLNGFSPKEAVSVDRWYVQQGLPPRRSSDFSAEFMTLRSLAAPPETITVDKWYQRLPDSVDRLRRTAWFQDSVYLDGFDPLETVSVDRWHIQTLEPVKKQREFQAEFMTLRSVAPPVETITMDKWWQLANQPDRKERRVAWFQDNVYLNGFSPRETIYIDKWSPNYPAILFKSFRPRTADMSGGPLGAVPILPTPPSASAKYFIDEYGNLWTRMSAGTFPLIVRLT